MLAVISKIVNKPEGGMDHNGELKWVESNG